MRVKIASLVLLLKEVGFVTYISFKGVKMNVISDLELQQIRTQMLTFAQLQVNQADLAEDLVQKLFFVHSKILIILSINLHFKLGLLRFLKLRLLIIYVRKGGLF